jgi:hypothetical protein
MNAFNRFLGWLSNPLGAFAQAALSAYKAKLDARELAVFLWQSILAEQVTRSVAFEQAHLRAPSNDG